MGRDGGAVWRGSVLEYAVCLSRIRGAGAECEWAGRTHRAVEWCTQGTRVWQLAGVHG